MGREIVVKWLGRVVHSAALAKRLHFSGFIQLFGSLGCRRYKIQDPGS